MEEKFACHLRCVLDFRCLRHDSSADCIEIIQAIFKQRFQKDRFTHRRRKVAVIKGFQLLIQPGHDADIKIKAAALPLLGALLRSAAMGLEPFTQF